MKRHIPFPTVLIGQVIMAILVLPLIALSFYMALSGPGMIIAVIVTLSLDGIDIGLIVLSLTFWWNVPIVVETKGILKRGTVHPWGSVSCVATKNYIRTRYGPLLAFLTTITYSDGKIIRFELTPGLKKDITKLCGDKRFLTMLGITLQSNNWPFDMQ